MAWARYLLEGYHERTPEIITAMIPVYLLQCFFKIALILTKDFKLYANCKKQTPLAPGTLAAQLPFQYRHRQLAGSLFCCHCGFIRLSARWALAWTDPSSHFPLSETDTHFTGKFITSMLENSFMHWSTSCQYYATLGQRANASGCPIWEYMGRIAREIAVIEVVTFSGRSYHDGHSLFVVNLNGIK